MSKYYFVVNSLPPLDFGMKPEISFEAFRDLLSLNLRAADLKQFEKLLWPVDLYNVKALWLGLPLDERGTLSPHDLEEALLVRDTLPEFLVEYLERYESTAERLRYFPSLYASLYRESHSGFLGFAFRLEWEIRLVLTALRAKRARRDVAFDLQFEDPLDPFVAQILAQKDAPEYAPPQEYEDLKVQFSENSSDSRKLAMALLQYRFNRYSEYETQELFTLDQILAYGARLLLLEGWEKRDEEKEQIALEELSRYE